jgi:hypothetical protein
MNKQVNWLFNPPVTGYKEILILRLMALPLGHK